MDQLRGIAVLLIVVFHAGEVPVALGWEGSTRVSEFGLALRPFRVPLLMVLSGLMVGRSLAKPLPGYVRGKVRHVVWPWAIWTLAMIPLGLEWLDPATLEFWVSSTHTWYLVALAFVYALALVTRRVPALLVSAAMIALHELGVVGWPPALDILWFGAFFFVGAWLAGVRDALLEVPRAAVATVAVTTVLLTVILDMSVRSMATFAVSVAGVVVVLWLGPRLPVWRFPSWIGRNSIVTYLVHFPALFLLWPVVAAAGVNDPAFTVPALAAFTIGVSALATWLQPRTPWLYAMPAGLLGDQRRPSLPRPTPVEPVEANAGRA